MRVAVDPELCQGHARCNLSAPELFQLSDEDGHAIVAVDMVPSGLEDKARRAAVGCPEQAIAVSE